MQLYKVINIVLVGLLVDDQQLIALEVPTGFVGVPVLFGNGDVLLDYVSINCFLGIFFKSAIWKVNVGANISKRAVDTFEFKIAIMTSIL